MKHEGGILGFLRGGLRSSKRKPPSSGPTARREGLRPQPGEPQPAKMQQLSIRTPTSLYRKRRSPPDTPRTKDKIPKACKCFRLCDQAWKDMSIAQRAMWTAAVKRPGMSGYDLWMSECLTAGNQGYCPPDEPSISGGWSNTKVKPGTCPPDWDLWGQLTVPYAITAIAMRLLPWPGDKDIELTWTWDPQAIIDHPELGLAHVWVVDPDPTPHWGVASTIQVNLGIAHSHIQHPDLDTILIQWPAYQQAQGTANLCFLHTWCAQAPNYVLIPPPIPIRQPWPNP